MPGADAPGTRPLEIVNNVMASWATCVLFVLLVVDAQHGAIDAVCWVFGGRASPVASS